MFEPAQDKRSTSGRFSRQLQAGEPLQKSRDCGTALESAELGTRAEVGAESERNMRVGLATDIEAFWIAEYGFIPVGRAKATENQIPPGNRLAVPFEVLCGRS